jgi:Ca2+-binding RTX toxin-like protein
MATFVRNGSGPFHFNVDAATKVVSVTTTKVVWQAMADIDGDGDFEPVRIEGFGTGLGAPKAPQPLQGQFTSLQFFSAASATTPFFEATGISLKFADAADGFPTGQLFAEDDRLIDTKGAQAFDGGPGKNIVDYSGTDTGEGAVINLGNNVNGGAAEGDSYDRITGVIGTKYHDWIGGTQVDDTLDGGDGDDDIWALGGNDKLIGGKGDDTLVGGFGDDTLDGGDGKDVLVGEFGKNLMFGGKGDDTLVSGTGNDTMDGGEGFDFASYWNTAGRINADLATGVVRVFDARNAQTQTDTIELNTIEGVFGSRGNDVIAGDGNENVLFGGVGNDNVNGRGGNDVVKGEEGNDTLVGGAGHDTLDGGAGNDRLTGGADGDAFVYETRQWGRDTITDFKLSEGDFLWFQGTGLKINDFQVSGATNAVISLKGVSNGPTITLTGVSANGLDLHDVIFLT